MEDFIMNTKTPEIVFMNDKIYFYTLLPDDAKMSIYVLTYSSEVDEDSIILNMGTDEDHYIIGFDDYDFAKKFLYDNYAVYDNARDMYVVNVNTDDLFTPVKMIHTLKDISENYKGNSMIDAIHNAIESNEDYATSYRDVVSTAFNTIINPILAERYSSEEEIADTIVSTIIEFAAMYGKLLMFVVDHMNEDTVKGMLKEIGNVDEEAMKNIIEELEMQEKEEE
jgi:hypothetical protein